jgi:hypothetical protein
MSRFIGLSAFADNELPREWIKFGIRIVRPLREALVPEYSSGPRERGVES